MESPTLTPVEAEIKALQKTSKTRGSDYQNLALSFLKLSLAAGFVSELALYSCWDLAATVTTDPKIKTQNQSKIDRWMALRAASNRPVGRNLSLELDPIFYCLIASKKKGFEGRAADFDNDRRYYDLVGNRVTFTVSRRNPEELDTFRGEGLHPNSIMSGFVDQVLFAPTVHAMFNLVKDNGQTFQPQIDDPNPLIARLKRAAVYYSFPDYPERIKRDGFFGIEFSRMHYFGVANAEDESYIYILRN